jgi:outer membrane receptor protein involved in Fe transport
VDSATLNVRRELGATVDAFADFSWYDNSGLSYGSGGEPNSVTLGTDAPNNPFTTPIVVRFPNPGLLFPVKSEVETLRGIGGVVVRLPSEWTAAADYGWNRSRYRSTSTGAGVSAAEGAALTNGTLNVMRDLNAFPLDYAPYLLPTPTSISGPFQTDLNDATLRLSGPLFHIWGGPLTLSGLAEWRKEQSSDSYQSSMNASSVESATFFPSRSQTVMSYYLEARAPLASKLNGRRMLRALELQASVRRDDYETHVSNPSQVPGLPSRGAPLPAFTSITNEVEATKYTVGLRYVPVDDLALRASYGTGFLPPSVSQLVSTTIPVPGGAMLIDPKRGNILANTGQFNRPQGGNPDLVPEDSESWSAGVVFTPRFLAGLRLSIDYTRITKTNEITTPALQTVLDLEDLLPGRVTRSALLPADAALGYTAGVIKTIDTTLVNIAASRLEAYDIQADYQWRSARLGDFRLYAVATYQPQLARQTVPNKAFVDSVGFDSGVLEWRGNAGLTWDKGPWTLGWNAQYYAAYFAYTSSATAATIATAVLNQGSARVPSQMYHDIFAAYRFDDSMFAAGMLHGVVVTLGIQNLFDKSPPITVISSVATVTGGYSTYGDPRLQRFSLSLQKHF